MFRLKVTRPEIYFGEQGSDYCFVKTHAQEFDYPQGDKDVYTSYQGAGGIPVENFWRRLLFALAFGEKNILFSSDIQPDSRLMIYRQVLDRAQRLTPFIHYDHDPYMVIADNGALFWMLDGYTQFDALSLLGARPRRRKLHPQLREGHHQCLFRRGAVLYQRPG